MSDGRRVCAGVRIRLSHPGSFSLALVQTRPDVSKLPSTLEKNRALVAEANRYYYSIFFVETVSYQIGTPGKNGKNEPFSIANRISMSALRVHFLHLKRLSEIDSV